jgi:hypothetical protein
VNHHDHCHLLVEGKMIPRHVHQRRRRNHYHHHYYSTIVALLIRNDVVHSFSLTVKNHLHSHSSHHCFVDDMPLERGMNSTDRGDVKKNLLLPKMTR